jgi:hypothetical protein
MGGARRSSCSAYARTPLPYSTNFGNYVFLTGAKKKFFFFFFYLLYQVYLFLNCMENAVILA